MGNSIMLVEQLNLIINTIFCRIWALIPSPLTSPTTTSIPYSPPCTFPPSSPNPPFSPPFRYFSPSSVNCPKVAGARRARPLDNFELNAKDNGRARIQIPEISSREWAKRDDLIWRVVHIQPKFIDIHGEEADKLHPVHLERQEVVRVGHLELESWEIIWTIDRWLLLFWLIYL